jgi:glycine cleavage system aminomethyltransferase T
MNRRDLFKGLAGLAIAGPAAAAVVDPPKQLGTIVGRLDQLQAQYFLDTIGDGRWFVARIVVDGEPSWIEAELKLTAFELKTGQFVSDVRFAV